MATLLSPGVSVTVTDESFYNTAGQGTVPLILIATASNKASPVAGAGIAPSTAPAQANKLYLATSQRDLIQNFGAPIFYSTQGTPLNGFELNEYGLFAAYSYLGVKNQAYILRADIDLSADVCRNRYGDCKDMATLLVTMLHDAGIQTAWPVLLGAGRTEPVHDNLAAPLFFNHAIVRADIDGVPVVTPDTICAMPTTPSARPTIKLWPRPSS